MEQIGQQSPGRHWRSFPDPTVAAVEGGGFSLWLGAQPGFLGHILHSHTFMLLCPGLQCLFYQPCSDIHSPASSWVIRGGHNDSSLQTHRVAEVAGHRPNTNRSGSGGTCCVAAIVLAGKRLW